MARSYPQLDLDAQICFPLYAASRAVTRRYTELLSGVDLTYPQYLTMLALWGSSPLSVGELGERLRLDSGTLTPLLKRLESAGHVVRRRSDDDERKVLVEPTAQGWAMRDQVRTVPLDLIASMDVTEEEGKALRTILEKLIAHLA